MVDVADARVVAVLTRAPSSGGKSRLFAELGRPPDRGLLEALLLDTIDGATTPGVRTVVAVSPGSSCDEVRTLLTAGRAAQVIAQADGDLGDRMRSTMAHLFACGAQAVALIGSDLPDITAAGVSAAFDALETDPDALVLGPATDGGYYLVAATRVPDVFRGIEWGSAQVLDQARGAARERGFRVHLIGPLADVDTVADLQRLSGGTRAPRTAAWLHAQSP